MRKANVTIRLTEMKPHLIYSEYNQVHKWAVVGGPGDAHALPPNPPSSDGQKISYVADEGHSPLNEAIGQWRGHGAHALEHGFCPHPQIWSSRITS